ncbi:hypothetical protein SARC_11655 [Sphaeroforma arctica JP610]|uniref:MBTPS1 fourth domain-containing protein n=1 Tax=Sphaeroforma arctica JP610 TaxID=667725 RepID=A0A0L0FIG0_9EUKA|nr:hypothetical protein SARC_11655 [Sphaeroforma arctica JP610]KNC75828.1 hypothetical protein SARC_11655 [Sphaeroforma arctica JP610]|eukprot:XP_014149730.1 hypothetical protein SARC_11655 [Sphaeroforma arctica JP610]
MTWDVGAVPCAGGANVPGLNALLEQFGMAFAGDVLTGTFATGPHSKLHHYRSGTSIARFPRDGYLLSTPLENQAGHIMRAASYTARQAAILGLYTLPGKGSNIVLYGDSNLIDEVHQPEVTFELFLELVRFAVEGTRDPHLTFSTEILDVDYVAQDTSVPEWPLRDVHQHKYNSGLPTTTSAACRCLNMSSPDIYLTTDTPDNSAHALPGLPAMRSDYEFKWTDSTDSHSSEQPRNGEVLGLSHGYLEGSFSLLVVAAGVLLLVRVVRSGNIRIRFPIR